MEICKYYNFQSNSEKKAEIEPDFEIVTITEPEKLVWLYEL